VAQDPQDPYGFGGGGDVDLSMMDPSFMQMDPAMLALLMHTMTAPTAPQAPTAPVLAPLGGDSGSFMTPGAPVSLGDPDLFDMGAKIRPPYGGPPPSAVESPKPKHDYTPHGAGDWMRILMPALLGIAGAAVGGPGGAAGAWQGYAKGEDEAEKRRMQQQALDQRTAVLQANERRYREMERQRDENNQRLRDATGSQIRDKLIASAMQFNDPEMQRFTLNQNAKELARYGIDARTLLPEVSVRAKARLAKWAQAALDKGLANVERAKGKDLDYSVLFARSDPSKPPEFVTPTDDGHTATFRELATWAGHDPDQYAQQLSQLKVKRPQNLPPEQQALMNREMAAFYEAHPERDPNADEIGQMQINVTQTLARARHIQTPEERAESTIFGREPTGQIPAPVFRRAGVTPDGEVQPVLDGDITPAAQEEATKAIQAGKQSLAQIPIDVEGEEFLRRTNIPENTKALIRAVAQGRAQIPGGFGGAGLRTEFLTYVTRYDPTFDVANPAARIQVRKNFTSGADSQSVSAINTLMGHLDILARASDAQQNGNFRLANWLINSITTALGEPETNDYNTVAGAVAREATRVWRGTGGSVEDVRAYTDQLGSSNSPRQQFGAMADLTELVESKLHSLSDKYEQGMGLSYRPPGGYYDPDTNPTGMKVAPSSWLLRPWAYDAMKNVYRRAGRQMPGEPLPSLLQSGRVVTPGATPGAAPAAPAAVVPGGPARTPTAAPVGPVRGTEPQPQAAAPTGNQRQLALQAQSLAREISEMKLQRAPLADIQRKQQQLLGLVTQLGGLAPEQK
jgi:hypothetical protein